MNKWTHRICIILSIALYTHVCHSFDPLFPTNDFKELIIRCMKARSAAQSITTNDESSFDLEIIYDCMLGRTVQIMFWAEKVINNSCAYQINDIEYLYTVLALVKGDVTNALAKYKSEEQQETLNILIAIESKLEHILN